MRGKNYTPEYKAAVLVEVLKEEKTVSEIAAERQLNPNMVRNWRRQFLDNAARVFDEGRSEREEKKREEAQARKTGGLHRIIGELTAERDWLQRGCIEAGGRVAPR